jgi:hypothetical protein
MAIDKWEEYLFDEYAYRLNKRENKTKNAELLNRLLNNDEFIEFVKKMK